MTTPLPYSPDPHRVTITLANGEVVEQHVNSRAGAVQIAEAARGGGVGARGGAAE